MKRVLFFVVAVIILASCNNEKHQKELAILQNRIDSLAGLTQQKQDSVMEFIGAFNDIQRTLDSIQEIEKMIAVKAHQPGSERNVTTKEKINQDIIAIHQMLTRNKQTVANLQAKLKKSNGRTAELEQMIDMLNSKIAEKDAELAILREDLAKLNIKVQELSTNVKDLTAENEAKALELEARANELNTAWFAKGTKKELRDNNVITREGGFLGIGRSTNVSKDFNADYFTRVDIRSLKYLPLNARKAKVVTSHPSDSYRISGERKADTLFITNSAKFWSASKYLVIQID